MARLSRIVVPDLPHHVAQRGNRRRALFVEPADCELYRDLLAERCRRVVPGLLLDAPNWGFDMASP